MKSEGGKKYSFAGDLTNRCYRVLAQVNHQWDDDIGGIFHIIQVAQSFHLPKKFERKKKKGAHITLRSAFETSTPCLLEYPPEGASRSFVFPGIKQRRTLLCAR